MTERRTAPRARGVTRLSRQTERKIYFVMTLALAGLWLVSRLWRG